VCDSIESGQVGPEQRGAINGADKRAQVSYPARDPLRRVELALDEHSLGCLYPGDQVYGHVGKPSFQPAGVQGHTGHDIIAAKASDLLRERPDCGSVPGPDPAGRRQRGISSNGELIRYQLPQRRPEQVRGGPLERLVRGGRVVLVGCRVDEEDSAVAVLPALACCGPRASPS